MEWNECRLLDVIYPRRCAVCGKALGFGEKFVHEECRGRLVYIREPRCRLCGRQLPDGSREEYCSDCRRHRIACREGRAVWLHDECMKQSLFEFKYAGRREYGKFYASEMAERFGRDVGRWQIDAVVPVPIHRDRMKKRGYNQSEVLGSCLAGLLGLNIRSDLLVRCEATSAQKDLGPAMRRWNLAHAFFCTGNAVPARILLIDDIYTTGSTVHRCAEALKSAGASDVFFLTVSVGGGA